MLINARFASTCPRCRGPIRVGERVRWQKGLKAEHAECEPAAPVNGASVVTRADMLAGRDSDRAHCQHCGEALTPWAVKRGFRRCVECAHGGQSYYDSRGNFVLGSDD